ncbi:hypothetical protein PCL_04237 [Purpureocillium lilacinum]|uniref:Uncharacterized protein n=3 Tax=Purpureocillium lilacinum TaxID=33203 RepID=A0A2U3ERB9_PURLI|nr:hypothetical protein PCL_04237 [Purpureocillium lilacinum]
MVSMRFDRDGWTLGGFIQTSENIQHYRPSMPEPTRGVRLPILASYRWCSAFGALDGVHSQFSARAVVHAYIKDKPAYNEWRMRNTSPLTRTSQEITMKVLQVLYVAVSLLGTVHGAPSQERRDTGAVAGTYPPVWKSNDAPAEDAKYPPDWKRDDSQFDAAKYPPDWKRDESQAEFATYPPAWKSDNAQVKGATYPPDWKRDKSQEGAAAYPPAW